MAEKAKWAQLEKRVDSFIRQHQIFEPGTPVVAACSGGPDSLALASILHNLREVWDIRLCIAHFEHGIRGKASEEDAEFVRGFAGERGIPFYIGREDIPEYSKRARLSLETAAREKRYAFLERTADTWGRGALIAVGHHRDDQAETVLMHLFRGSGVEGLAGMRPRSGRIIRPLLGVSRAEIEAYCKERSLEPRTDETNFSPDAGRNRVRLELLPAIRQYYPSVNDALCRLAAAQAETADFLRETAETVWDAALERENGENLLRLEAFRRQPAAVRKAILRRMADEAGFRQSLGFQHYEALDRFCCKGEPGKRLRLPKGGTAECRYGTAVLRQAEETPVSWTDTPLSLSGITRIEALGLTIHAAPWKIGDPVPDSSAAVVDVDGLKPPIVVRKRRDGDSFRLENGGRQKLKSLLIDRKVPRVLRDRIPIFTAGGEIFWVGGLRRAASALLTGNTERAAILRMEWDDNVEYTKGRIGHDDR